MSGTWGVNIYVDGRGNKVCFKNYNEVDAENQKETYDHFGTHNEEI